MSDPSVRHFHVKLNNSVTHLIQYGCKESFIKVDHQQTSSDTLETISEQPQNQSLTSPNRSTILAETVRGTRIDDPKLASARLVIVFVPGNPGVLGVYHDFLVSLYRNISKLSENDSNVLIVGIGHNDFDHPDSCNYKSGDRLCIEENELNFVERSIAKEHKPHDVELQVLNKLIILKRVVKLDKNPCRVVFIGHSIGCYVILRLLQDKMLAAIHAGSILIHPALENLALTKKGTRISRYFDFKLDLVMRFAAYICELIFPDSLRIAVAKRLCSPDFVQSSSEIVIESVAQLGCSNAVKALVEMARSEFKQVRDMDHKTLIEPHVDKLKLIYAIGDEWVNVNSREELLRSYPKLHIEEQPTPHAFIMDLDVVADYSMKIGMLVRDFFD